MASDALFDGIEVSDVTESLGRYWRAGALVKIMEPAPGMGPAGRDNDPFSRQPLKAGIAIDLQNTAEVREVERRPFGLAVGSRPPPKAVLTHASLALGIPRIHRT